jgi:hypothetical protein
MPEHRLVPRISSAGEDYIAHNNAERVRYGCDRGRRVRARSACTFPKRREQLGQGKDSPSRMTVGSLVIVCLRPIRAAACDSPGPARRARRRGRDVAPARLRCFHADDCRGHELLRSLASTLAVSVAAAAVKRRHPGRVIAPVALAPAPYIFVVCQSAHFSFP